MKPKMKSRPITEGEYKKKLLGVHGDTYKLNGKYVNMNVRTTFVDASGKEFSALPKEVLQPDFSAN